GIYIPFLTAKLLSSPIPGLALKGIAIGNAYTDVAVEAPAFFEYMYTHALISIETHRAIQTNCGDQLVRACLQGNLSCSNDCARALVEGYLSSDSFAMDPYYIYGDVCQIPSSQASLLPSPKLRPMHRGVIGPCAAQYTASYLRQPEVQKVLHIPTQTQWTDCSAEVSFAYHSSPSALQKYPSILKSGMKVLIYAGDADTVVNFMGTQRWLTQEGLNLSVVSPWRGWFGPDKQLAGYTEGYTNLTFTTVKGAGHMVPAMRPLHALYMFECFVYGDAACAKFTYPVDGFEALTGAATTTDSSATSHGALWTVAGIAVGVAVVAGLAWGYRKMRGSKAEYAPLTA
ncbi:serine protease family S10, partial [Achlya hypogyna]